MNVRTAPRMDKDAFFAWIDTQERKFELVHGVPAMQARVTRGHSMVVMHIARLLLARLDTDRYHLSMGEFAVETGPETIRFADVMVEPAGGPAKGLWTRDAILLVEVLSPSSARIDFGPKLAEYKQLNRLGSYLVCAQDEPKVSVWTRSPDGSWPADPDVVSGIDADVSVPSLGIVLPLAEIYRGLPA